MNPPIQTPAQSPTTPANPPANLPSSATELRGELKQQAQSDRDLAKSTLLSKIDSFKEYFTPEGLDLVKKKFQTEGQANFSLSANQIEDLLKRVKDSFEKVKSQGGDLALHKEYISKAISWGGLALISNCPTREAFVTYANSRYGQDYSTQFRNDISQANSESSASLSDRSRGIVPAEYQTLINKYASKYGVNPNLVAAIMKNESNFDPRARSHVGASGLMQIMPDTEDWIAGRVSSEDRKLSGVERNIAFGTWYLSYLSKMFNGDMAATIRAYNAGPGNEQTGRSQQLPETIAYLKKVWNSFTSFA